MKNKLIALLLSALFTVAAAGCQSNSGQAAPDGSNWEEVVASYDDYTVTLGDYRFYYRTYQNSMQSSALNNGYTQETLPEYWNLERNGQTAREALAESAMIAAKQYAVMHHLAVESGAQVPEETAAATQAEVDRLLEETGGDQDAFYAKYLLTPDEMLNMYNQFDLVQQYQDDLLTGIEVSQQELDQLYQQDPARYDQVTVRHILITAGDDMTEEEKAAAKQKAEDLLAQIEAGGDIGALAKEHSEDGGSKDNNGEYTFGKGQMVQPFEEWSFSAQPGDHGIVETSYGYHVMEMIEYIPCQEEDIHTQLEQQLRYEQANTYLSEKMQAADSEEWTVNQDLIDTVTVENA